jgi:PIN domain nuclease of toxin-antitoxin system
MSAVLLDTCAAVWLSSGAAMSPAALDEIGNSAAERRLWISPISGWEVATKIAAGKLGAPDLRISAADWYNGLLALEGVKEAAITGEIALRSAALPWLHRDPADRFLISAAIALGAQLITRDRLIFAYAEAGLVQVLPC